MAPKKPPIKRSAKLPDAATVPAEGERLWAPWRYEYLTGVRSDPMACIFCFGKLSEAERRERLVLFDNRDLLVMLNKYPYNNGHIMVAPRRHVASPELLPRADRAAIADAVAASIKRVREKLHPQALNVGANLGGAAGAGIADHMHWHVVPRWGGDNNFMPVLASTRVLSQSLEDSYDQLRPIFKNLGAELS
ncbi:MAG TPA: HIT domain-containing protein [Candidatus Sulfotelmatobacter sp.]|jgi:ATP adenylyltransferase|nr:HIT domain-containing protein [Candidatus Sulfotelmatobacter sp.]